MLASPLWGRLLTHLKTGQGFALVSLLLAIGTVPALVWPAPWAVNASALIFGASFMAGSAAVSVVAQRVLPHSSLIWGAGFAYDQRLPGAVDRLTECGLWLGPALLLLGAAASL